MKIMRFLRFYHLVFAIVALSTYASNELFPLHIRLGYTLTAIIAFRLLWGFLGGKQVNFARFYPSFKGFSFKNALTHPFINRAVLLGLLLSLLAAILTGFGLIYHYHFGVSRHMVKEIHEMGANLFIFFAIFHATYLLVFKFSFARFFLFLDKD